MNKVDTGTKLEVGEMRGCNPHLSGTDKSSAGSIEGSNTYTACEDRLDDDEMHTFLRRKSHITSPAPARRSHGFSEVEILCTVSLHLYREIHYLHISTDIWGLSVAYTLHINHTTISCSQKRSERNSPTPYTFFVGCNKSLVRYIT